MQACVFGQSDREAFLPQAHRQAQLSVHMRTLNRLMMMLEYLSRNPISAIDMGRKELIEMQERDDRIKRIKRDLALKENTQLPVDEATGGQGQTGQRHSLLLEAGGRTRGSRNGSSQPAQDLRTWTCSNPGRESWKGWPGLGKDIQEHVQTFRENIFHANLAFISEEKQPRVENHWPE